MRLTFDVLLEQRAWRHPERTALIFEERTLTYAELDRLARQYAAFLLASGIERGSRFGLLELNSTDSYAAALGALRIGAVPVYLNWRLSPPEIDFILSDAECCLLLYGHEFQETVGRLEYAGPSRLMNSVFVSEIAALSVAHAEPDRAESCDEDVLVQLYTSGTTGRPKGVLLNHANLFDLLQILQMELPAFSGQSVNLVCAPNYHIGGIAYFLFGLFAGACNVVQRVFEPQATRTLIRMHGVTNALLVPAMIQAVLRTEPADPAVDDFVSLVHVQYGGSPISEPLLERAAALLGCDFTQAYGLTETSGIATFLRYDDHRAILAPNAPAHVRQRIASAGRPCLGMRLRIVDQTGVEVPVGGIGEVQISGPLIMQGYWNRPDANRESLTADGWFCTGDVGRVDEDGYLYLLDRLKNMIVSGGENIYASEVERVLVRHDRIADVAVIGIPDDVYGESVCAIAVSEPAGEPPIQLEALREWARTELAGYKLPRTLLFVDELPRNPSGKVLHRVLRKRFWSGQTRNIH